MDDFPSNRKQPTRPAREIREGPKAEERKIERIIEGEVTRRKKPFGRKLRELFVGDGRSVRDMILEDIIVPGFRDVAFDAFQTGLEGVFYRGDHRPTRRPSQRGGFGGGNVRYDRISNGGSSRRRFEDPRDRRDMSPRGRANHDFDEVLLDSKAEADEVLTQLFDYLEMYDAVSVADLYQLVGITSTPIDFKWGWTDLRGSGVTRIRGGQHLLDLPTPEPLRD